MGPAAMERILAKLEWQGESLMDDFHVSYIIRGHSLNHGAAINYWHIVEGRTTGDMDTVKHSI